MTAAPFDSVLERSAARKGGKDVLMAQLPPVPNPEHIRRLPNNFFLAEMTKCVFRAGFVWKVVENKWPGFEEAFLQFDIQQLLSLPGSTWEAYAEDARIIRNMAKVRTVRDNALFVATIATEHETFANWLLDWPANDQIGQLAYLKKHASRLGGMSGQYFLRFAGRDSFILSRDVVLAIQTAGVDIADNPSSRRDLQAAQDTFNQWHAESGLAYTHLSRIAAQSAGVNYSTI